MNSSLSTHHSFCRQQTPLHLLMFHHLHSIANGQRCEHRILVPRLKFFLNENIRCTSQNRLNSQFRLLTHRPQNTSSSVQRVYCFYTHLFLLSDHFRKTFSTQPLGSV